MSFGAPSAPDAGATAARQQQYNVEAGQEQNKNNSYNQSTPFGSLNYVADPNSPSGYRIDTSLSDAQQGLLNTRQGTQQQAGNAARTLFDNSAGMYSHPFNENGSAVTDKLNNWSQQYLQPIYNQQASNLEAQLRNQGLQPGSEAYNNAKNLLARNQGDTTNQYLQQNQQQGFNQALTEYQQPLQTVAGLMGAASPQGPSFASSPTAQIQPANYMQAAQNQFADQQMQYQNKMAGLGQLAGAGLGMFGGGGMFGANGAFPGMFGGGWG